MFAVELPSAARSAGLVTIWGGLATRCRVMQLDNPPLQSEKGIIVGIDDGKQFRPE